MSTSEEGVSIAPARSLRGRKLATGSTGGRGFANQRCRPCRLGACAAETKSRQTRASVWQSEPRKGVFQTRNVVAFDHSLAAVCVYRGFFRDSSCREPDSAAHATEVHGQTDQMPLGVGLS